MKEYFDTRSIKVDLDDVQIQGRLGVIDEVSKVMRYFSEG